MGLRTVQARVLPDWSRIRRDIDAWILTAAQILGLAVGVYAVAIDQFRNPALLPAATGLLLLKPVAGRKDSE